MKTSKLILGFFLGVTLFLNSCKPKDSDIQALVEANLRTNPSTMGAVVKVDKGVATLSGELANDNARAECERIAAATKNVKSVVNNITVTPPPTPVTPPVISSDEALIQGVKDATKDFPTVTATVANGVVLLTGTIKRTELSGLMQSLSALHPGKIDNKLIVK